MKIEIEPTNEFQDVNGTRCRVWLGKFMGAEIRFWVRAVSPQTHNPEVCEVFARELREVKGEYHGHAYDLRLFID